MSAHQASDWRRSDDYAWLAGGDRGAFAWEWLRRRPIYRAHWREKGAEHRFGLVRTEDPALDARAALPLWSAASDPGVLRATAVPAGIWAKQASGTEGALGSGSSVVRGRVGTDIVYFRAMGLELRRLRHGVLTHLLVGTGGSGVRIDLLGEASETGPMVPLWHLAGIGGLKPQLLALHRLSVLCEGRDLIADLPSGTRVERQILMLRCADALAADATHQAIARGLFGPLVPASRWRLEASSIRLRVQRLAEAARAAIARDTRDWLRSG